MSNDLEIDSTKITMIACARMHVTNSMNLLMQNGETPLYYACRGGSVKAVHLLVDSGALVNEVQHCYVNSNF